MLMLSDCYMERKECTDKEKKGMDSKREQAKKSEYNGERWRK